jgi:exosome complex component MTR3
MLALPAIPLVRPLAPAAPVQEENNERQDKRHLDQLRPLKIRTGVVTAASGSAMIEMAHTKVICSVYGPHATEGRDFLQHGQLECSLRFASFARRGRPRTRSAAGPSAEERGLGLELLAALSSSVQLHLHPKSTIAVHALVLQDDGGALPAAISCASLALADASIGLFGLVAACSSALLGEGQEAALDCTAMELAGASATISTACMPSLDQLTLVRHEGNAPFERVTAAMQLALSGCSLLHGEMASALRKRIVRASQPGDVLDSVQPPSTAEPATTLGTDGVRWTEERALEEAVSAAAEDHGGEGERGKAKRKRVLA